MSKRRAYFYLPADLHHRISIRAAELKTSMSALVAEWAVAGLEGPDLRAALREALDNLDDVADGDYYFGEECCWCGKKNIDGCAPDCRGAELREMAGE